MRRSAHLWTACLLAASSAATAQTPAELPTEAAAAPRPSTIIPPTWVKRPTGDDFSRVYPAAAERAGIGGVVVIRCKVNTEGRLDDCTVPSEVPEGYGFGEAGLKLASKFQMSRIVNGHPVGGGEVSIPLNFHMEDEKPRPQMLAQPLWRLAPNRAAVQAAYPVAAKGAAGEAVIRCGFNLVGQPARCSVRSQSPAGEGFGDAALALSKGFVLDFQPGEEAQLSAATTQITVRFSADGVVDKTPLPPPRWVRTLTPQAVDALFPAEARAASVTNGLGTVACVANNRGGFGDCKVVGETPADLGFGAAALKAVEVMRINPWSEDGRPMEGRELTLPIRLKLSDSPKP